MSSLRDQLVALQARTISSRELVEHTLAAIDATQSTLNAFRAIRPDEALASLGPRRVCLQLTGDVEEERFAVGWSEEHCSDGQRPSRMPAGMFSAGQPVRFQGRASRP